MRLRLCILCCFLGQAVAATASFATASGPSPDRTPEQQGIVLDEVAPDSQIDKAGLRAGDVLLRWERLPAPPANPRPAQGALTSPFDWMWLEVEQAHRGTVVLQGERNGHPRVWRVAAGEWNVHFNAEPRARSRARPILAAPDARHYEQGFRQVRRRQVAEGTAAWRSLADRPGQDDFIRRWLLLRIGEAWGEVGEWPRAHEVFREALEGAQGDRVRVFLGEAVGKSLEYQGRFREGQDIYRVVLALRRETEPDSLGVARSLHQVNSQELHLGSLDRAKKGFDEELALRTRQAPGSFLEADSLHAQGLLAIERSALESAESYLKRAVAIQERLDPESFFMAFKLEGLGDVYALRGDLDVAAHHFERALAIRQRLVPNGESVATSLIRLGRLKLDQGNWREARSFFERGRSILQRVFPQHPMVAAVFNDLGATALATGDLARAETSYRQALRHLAEISPDSPWNAQIWNGLAEVEARRGHRETAISSFEKALTIYQRVGSGTDGEARALAGLGRLAWRAGDLESASRRFQEAIRALEAQVGRLGGSEDVKAEFRALRRRVSFEAAAVELELGHEQQAFDIQEASRAQGFLSLLAARDLHVSDGVPPELEEKRRQVGRRFRKAQSAIHSINVPADPEVVDKAWRELPILREQLDAIAQEIRKLSPRPTSLHFPQPLRAADLARELDPGLKVLAYQVGASTTQVFVLSPDGSVVARSLPEGVDALQRDVARIRAAVENQSPTDRNGALRSLRRLYSALVQPVEPVLASADRLLILPDGPLHALPWAALVRDLPKSDPADGRTWQFLTEWKPFAVALSATVWAELKRSRELPPSPEEPAPAATSSSRPIPPITAFGDPAFGAASLAWEPMPSGVQMDGARRRGLVLSPLPHSRREVESIGQLFPGRLAAFLGSEATEERAKNLPRATRIVHFATHGFTDERLPMSSGLVLTIPERPHEQAEDGLLQAWEIFESVRLEADLVVLSACDSGRGKDLGGEGLLSLTRAFQFAGARAVVASLWKVPDDGSADFMARFYRHLKSGAAAEEALREAQLERIAELPWLVDEPGKAGVNFSRNLVWAAFEVFGDGAVRPVL